MISIVQGDLSGWLLAFVDIETKVPLQYGLLILKGNFQFEKLVFHLMDHPVNWVNFG